ncbi:hypothetical protein [Nocardioides sp. LS1]|uniref:hypothetical protein n=1 Tax=Nocardioides sp. LS1 TaxID=1027620 RepID=UPI000F61C66F|nr:hypothetical protein [Nocardioides sp. LS1]GCD90168.1 hypothetical protein NLS1_21740 [Nocardioides sp. LS1]
MTGGQVHEMAEVVGPFWSEARAVAALGVSAETVASRRDSGTILALPTNDGVLVYPVDQFQKVGGGGDDVEVKPALLPFLRALRGFDPWAVAVLLHTPAPELDGATPLGWLSDGGAPDTLTRLGEVVAREWASSGPPSVGH